VRERPADRAPPVAGLKMEDVPVDHALPRFRRCDRAPCSDATSFGRTRRMSRRRITTASRSPAHRLASSARASCRRPTRGLRRGGGYSRALFKARRPAAARKALVIGSRESRGSVR
jgi:hypothetical protein